MSALPEPSLPVIADVQLGGCRIGRHVAWAPGLAPLLAIGLQPAGSGAVPVCVLHPGCPEVCLLQPLPRLPMQLSNADNDQICEHTAIKDTVELRRKSREIADLLAVQEHTILHVPDRGPPAADGGEASQQLAALAWAPAGCQAALLTATLQVRHNVWQVNVAVNVPDPRCRRCTCAICCACGVQCPLCSDGSSPNRQQR